MPLYFLTALLLRNLLNNLANITFTNIQYEINYDMKVRRITYVILVLSSHVYTYMYIVAHIHLKI